MPIDGHSSVNRKSVAAWCSTCGDFSFHCNYLNEESKIQCESNNPYFSDKGVESINGDASRQPIKSSLSRNTTQISTHEEPPGKDHCDCWKFPDIPEKC